MSVPQDGQLLIGSNAHHLTTSPKSPSSIYNHLAAKHVARTHIKKKKNTKKTPGGHSHSLNMHTVYKTNTLCFILSIILPMIEMEPNNIIK